MQTKITHSGARLGTHTWDQQPQQNQGNGDSKGIAKQSMKPLHCEPTQESPAIFQGFQSRRIVTNTLADFTIH